MVKGVKKSKSISTASLDARDRILVENFVGLQRAMTNLAMKFEDLSDNISKLLGIFEISAKDFLENKGSSSMGVEKDLINKLNSLLEQNKAIAKGLLIMNDSNRRQEQPRPQKPTFSPQPVQQSQPPAQQFQQSTSLVQESQAKPKPLQ